MPSEQVPDTRQGVKADFTAGTAISSDLGIAGNAQLGFLLPETGLAFKTHLIQIIARIKETTASTLTTTC